MSAELNRVRWRCRRGHLELDLYLQSFLDRGYSTLGAREREVFARLLEEPDETLWDWLMQARAVPDAELRDVVAKIRSI